MTILHFGGHSSIVKTRLPSHFARSGHKYAWSQTTKPHQLLFYEDTAIVRQPSSYTLHRLLKLFLRRIIHPHGIYIAYLSEIKRISLSDLRKLNKLKKAAIWEGRTINLYHFRHNRGKFVFLVSILGFWGMPDIVVLSGNILDIASQLTQNVLKHFKKVSKRFQP